MARAPAKALAMSRRVERMAVSIATPSRLSRTAPSTSLNRCTGAAAVNRRWPSASSQTRPTDVAVQRLHQVGIGGQRRGAVIADIKRQGGSAGPGVELAREPVEREIDARVEAVRRRQQPPVDIQPVGTVERLAVREEGALRIEQLVRTWVASTQRRMTLRDGRGDKANWR